MEKIGVGFVGYGMIGRVHALAYRELGHYYYAFLSAVTQNREPVPSAADGLAVQRVISAAYASAQKNQWQEVDL